MRVEDKFKSFELPKELRKLAKDLAKLYGWDIKDPAPRGVTRLLLQSAEELEK